MRQEYKDKINLAWDMLDYKDELSIEENEKCFDVAYDTLNELVETKDQEVLESLLEFFCEDHEDYGGICEHLESQIGCNYTLDQLIKTFYKKFDYLTNHAINRCKHLSSWFLYNEKFNEFRDMFNTVKSSGSSKFLDALQKWIGDEFPDEIALLREDMKKW